MFVRSLSLMVLVQICTVALGDEGFYNIAHMVNTPGAVEWALGRGANAVEIDLTFDTTTGTPLIFRHSASGEACDCTCLCPAPFWRLCAAYPNSVCANLLNYVSNISPCRAESSVESLLSTLAGRTRVALVVIDSKIDKDSMSDETMRKAGHAVVQVLSSYLFANGYGGKVVIGSPKLDTLPYLQASVASIKDSSYESRVYFTIDSERDNIVDTLRTLHTLPTKNIVYGTGISACSPTQIKTSTMQLAAFNKAKGVTGLSYLWTIDKNSTILDNLPYVQGVMSNYPRHVYDIVIAKGLKLATQSSTIPSATSSDVVSCDCDYHPGGCTISKPAPSGLACHCVYKGAWTCGGTVAQCSDQNSNYCKNPDKSVHSCLLGDGDCEGYKTATCDCNYQPGGCSISLAAPPNTACMCKYRGAWTCGGEVVRCVDINSQYCKSPDKTIQSCFQGRGDCEGYKTATCDCDYHRGGCTISKVPPPNTACRCSYKGWWTCGGSITACRDFNSYYCQHPDSSRSTCNLGGGDCGGY